MYHRMCIPALQPTFRVLCRLSFGLDVFVDIDGSLVPCSVQFCCLVCCDSSSYFFLSWVSGLFRRDDFLLQ